MKNLFFALAFMLVGTFAFANTSEVENVLTFDDGTIELINSKELGNANFVNTPLSSVLGNFLDLAQVESITTSNSDCSGVTVTLGGGDSFVWSGSCAGLWRLIRAYLSAP